jgi:hypothetical protein
MNVLDDAIAVMSAPGMVRAKESRIAAGTKLDEAAKIMSRAKSDTDLRQAQDLLDRAQADIASARRLAQGDAATSPSGNPTAAGMPPVYPVGGAATGAVDWAGIPENEKGVCFFCSQPEMLKDLTPVTVKLENQPQKVLACPDDLRTVKSGAMPQIRAFERDGRYVPWYADDRYDPYRDYYDRGYSNRSLMGDLVTLSIIDSMFWNWRHPVGWGWGGGYGYGNGYAFYSDHDSYRDYYSHQAASSGDFGQVDDAAGSGFLQDVGGNEGPGDIGADQS